MRLMPFIRNGHHHSLVVESTTEPSFLFCPCVIMTDQSKVVPPQLVFDDGSRVMVPATDAAPSTDTPASNSPRGRDMSIETYYEINRVVTAILQTIKNRGRRNQDDGWLCRVALQFPDELLEDSTEVTWAMEEALLHDELNLDKLEPLVFVLGDTTFGPCCPDEVSALHLDADVLVHYGHACLSPAMSLPVLYSFGMTDMNVGHCVDTVLSEAMHQGIRQILLLYEVRYHHAMEDLQTQLSERGDILVVAGHIPEPINTDYAEYGDTGSKRECCEPDRRNDFDACTGEKDGDGIQSLDEEDQQRKTEPSTIVVGGLELPANIDLSNYTVLFIGDPTLETGSATSRQYVNTMLRFLSTPSGPTNFWTYSPLKLSLETELPSYLQRQLNRRFYLTQKARDASVFGILVGTLSQRHFRSVVSSLRRLIEDSGRSCYTFAVGKINQAKLANFGEIDCYVLVACGENSLLDGERDFHVPVITPLELNIALGNVEWGSVAYSLNYHDFLALQKVPSGDRMDDQSKDSGDADAPYFSLVRGAYVDSKGKASNEDLNLAALPGKGQLTAYKSEASEFLKKREYKGLETKLGESNVEAAVQGQFGVASNYGEQTETTL